MKNDFKSLTFEEILQKREELSTELMEKKFKSVTGQIESPILKRTLKRQIARLNTRLYEIERNKLNKSDNN